jgi:hypothetical protein
MIIQRNAGVVGSLSGSDPNAQSFQHPAWNKRRDRDSQKLADSTEDQDSSGLAVDEVYRHCSEAEQADLGNVISFGQTQEAFLGKVHEALQRMQVLTALTEAEKSSNQPVEGYLAEFGDLQAQIRAIRVKMSEAASAFEAKPLRTISDLDDSGFRLTGPESEAIMQVLEAAYDPALVDIGSEASALTAKNCIQTAIALVSQVRAKMEENLQKVRSVGECTPQATFAGHLERHGRCRGKDADHSSRHVGPVWNRNAGSGKCPPRFSIAPLALTFLRP